MLAVADGPEVGELAAVDEQRHAGLPSPNGAEPAELGAERRDSASRRARSRRRASPAAGPRRSAPRRHARRTLRRTPRRARRRSSARPPRDGRRSARGARRTRPARRAGRTPIPTGPSPSTAPSVPAIIDDGAVVALDEARRDDPDHALVPALAGDDVAAPPAARLGPRLDLVDRLAQDPLLDRLPLAVQRLELLGQPFASRSSSVSSSASAASGRHEPSGRVDARREPEADRRLVERRRRRRRRRASAPAAPASASARAAAARAARARGSRRRAARRRRRSRARRCRGAVRGTDGPRRAAPRRASRRRPCRRARRTGSRPSASPRRDMRGTPRPAGGGR